MKPKVTYHIFILTAKTNDDVIKYARVYENNSEANMKAARIKLTHPDYCIEVQAQTTDSADTAADCNKVLAADGFQSEDIDKAKTTK